MFASRHLVNFGLLFSFSTLAVSGLLSFFRPFSLVTTRVHIVFGLTTFLLVGLHLAVRLSYFRNQFHKVRQQRSSFLGLLLLAASWAVLLLMAILNAGPIHKLITLGYEAQHHSEIVRASSLVGFLASDSEQIITREPGPDADVAVSLLVRLTNDTEHERAPTSHRSNALAIWAETLAGTMIETLYLDGQLAYSDQPMWNGLPTPRQKILPIWRHRYTAISGVEPNGELDAFTGATSSHSFSLTDYLRLGEQKEFVVCVEVNAAGDVNEKYADQHLGQPSLLYTTVVDIDSPARYRLLELTGHGGGDADKSGAIQYDLQQITTARELLDLVLVKATTEF